MQDQQQLNINQSVRISFIPLDLQIHSLVPKFDIICQVIFFIKDEQMDELEWELLIEVFGRMEAELIQSMLNAYGIDVELFQESIGHFAYPTTIDGLARVQVFVKKDKFSEANELLENFKDGSLENGISS
jgi:hypothetical protein